MSWGPLLAAAPWLAAVAIVLWRVRQSRSLDEYSAGALAEPPSLSVVVPARNESANITRCVASLRASTYAALEVIVVDDHSSDDTARLAREAAGGDSRIRVVAARDLEPGWLGKQWACAHGASLARGRVLCFTDADTVHAPDLHVRSVRALRPPFSARQLRLGRRSCEAAEAGWQAKRAHATETRRVSTVLSVGALAKAEGL